MKADARVVFFSDLPAMARLEQAWDALARDAAEPVFFQSFGWVRHVARIKLECAARSSWRLCLATIWIGDELVGIWPLALQKAGLCWIAKCLDEPFGQFAGLLRRRDLDPGIGVRTVVQALKHQDIASGLRIERVVEGSQLHQQLLEHGATIAFSDNSVFLDFRPFASYEAYLKSLRAKTRKNLRNARNRLERDHRVRHQITTEPDEIAAIMADTFEGRLVWMQEHAKTAPAFRDATFRHLLDGLRNSPVADQLLGFRLHTENDTISAQWGFVFEKRYYAYISARNPAFDSFSAGRVHLGMVLEACWERDIEVVELMAPRSDYKLNWTKSIRRIDDFGLPLTPGGYLYLEVWRRHGRAMAKRLYETLPDSLRRPLSQATNRNATHPKSVP